jgi:hypothetical protein
MKNEKRDLLIAKKFLELKMKSFFVFLHFYNKNGLVMKLSSQNYLEPQSAKFCLISRFLKLKVNNFFSDEIIGRKKEEKNKILLKLNNILLLRMSENTK